MRLAIATVAETRRLETAVIEEGDYPQLQLMERAASAVATLAHRLAAGGAPLYVVAGPGNNGADGLAAARILTGLGHAPLVYQLPGRCAPAVGQQRAWAERWGVPILPWDDAVQFPPGSLLVDAIFGFGLHREPAGPFAAAVAAINRCRASTVIAVDLPSGVEGTRGVVLGTAVNATHTVACGVLKSGLLSDPALDSVGSLYLGEIGFPASSLAELPGEVLEPRPMPRRSAAAHKGSAGFTLVVGGSRAMSGAPAMAALGAGRIGAGLVYAAVPGSIRDVVAAQMPEAVVMGLPETVDGDLAPEAWEAIAPLLERCKAGVLGPGLGCSSGALELASRLMSTWDRPLVVDADALTMARNEPRAPGTRLFTPHAGEAARLLASTPDAVQADRLASALELAKGLAGIVMLKGARTIVAEPSGRYAVNVLGHAVMATAGSGDVLAGMLAGLLAQGWEPVQAARQAVAIHGLCGMRAAESSPHAILALDLLTALPGVLGQLAPFSRHEAPLIPLGS